jgi:hypothetical protein
MNVTKSFFAAACVLTCLMGNDYPAHADTVDAWCSYTRQDDYSIPIVEGDCVVSQYGTFNGATNYVTLSDGTELSYDGRQEGIDFTRTIQDGGVWLQREGIDTLIIFWDGKPAREPGGW